MSERVEGKQPPPRQVTKVQKDKKFQIVRIFVPIIEPFLMSIAKGEKNQPSPVTVRMDPHPKLIFNEEPKPHNGSEVLQIRGSSPREREKNKKNSGNGKTL
jgi:hypothetical protein